MKFTNGWAGAALAAGLLALSDGSASAQEVRSQPTTQVRRVSEILGATLQLQAGGSYGKIEDIVINDNGCIDYIVVSNQDQYVVIPWSAATVNFEQRIVRVNVTQERLRELAFTRDRWPTFSDPQFLRRIESVYGVSAPRREGVGGRPGVAPDRQRPPEGQPGTRPPDRQRPPETQPGQQRPPQTQPGQPQPPDRQRPPETQPGQQRPPETQPGQQRPPQADPNRRPPERREPPRRPEDPSRPPPPNERPPL